MNIINSTVQRNSSTEMGPDCNFGGGQSGGGGIYASGPILTVVQSEIRDNCGSNGGGISLLGSGHHLIRGPPWRGTARRQRAPACTWRQACPYRGFDDCGQRRHLSGCLRGDGRRHSRARQPGPTILSSTIVGNQNQFEGTEGAGESSTRTAT